MARKEFPRSVVESVLIKSKRHCCICREWCGQKIEIHHIGSPEDNSENNAIPVCFNCHADLGHYSAGHPKGKKYSPSELRKLRDLTFDKYSHDVPDMPEGLSDYGRGFHDGVEWAEKFLTLKEVWRLLSSHGDFVLEILIHFEDADTHTMMDEMLMDDRVENEIGRSQYECYLNAWSSGRAAGLWDLDGNREELFLTKCGKIFRELVRLNPELRNRFQQLKDFWQGYPFEKPVKRPQRIQIYEHGDFPPGFMNWLQMEIYSIARITRDRSRTYIIQDVTPERVELKNIETGESYTLHNNEIKDMAIDQESGELLIETNP